MYTITLMDEINKLDKETMQMDLITIDDARRFYISVIKLIFDYKMVGRIYDFYDIQLNSYGDNQLYSHNVENYMKNVLAFVAAFPDVTASVENTIVNQDGDGFKVYARIRFHGTNTGVSHMGAPTGKSLGNRALSTHVLYIRRIGQQWKIVRQFCTNSMEWINSVLTADEQALSMQPSISDCSETQTIRKA